MRSKRIVIVIPTFNDSVSLRTLIEQLGTVFAGQTSDVSLLIVDDGSILPLADSVEAEFKTVLHARVLTLKRNLGHACAIAIGIAHAVHDNLADILVIMDADGEDKPSDLPRLIAALSHQDDMAIVVGERRKRSERLLFRMFYQLYRILFLALTGYRIRFGNLSAMPIAAARRLADMSELWLSLPATILRSHHPILMVPTDRGSRLHGRSHMSIVSLIVFGLSAVAVFVERGLTRIILGAIALVALAAFASATAIKSGRHGNARVGYLCARHLGRNSARHRRPLLRRPLPQYHGRCSYRAGAERYLSLLHRPDRRVRRRFLEQIW